MCGAHADSSKDHDVCVQDFGADLENDCHRDYDTGRVDDKADGIRRMKKRRSQRVYSISKDNGDTRAVVGSYSPGVGAGVGDRVGAVDVAHVRYTARRTTGR